MPILATNDLATDHLAANCVAAPGLATSEHDGASAFAASRPAVPSSPQMPVCKESQILNGAAEIFAQDGYEGASMSRIATQAGVSKGTLYNYFASKAELFAAYIHRDCARWIALVFDDLDPATPPEQALREVGLRMFAMLLSEPSLVMYRMVVAEAQKFPELARTFYGEGPARSVCHLSRYIGQAAAKGRLRVDDAEFAAEQFLALIQTHLSMKRRLHLIGMPSDAEIEHVVDGAVHLFMKTYGIQHICGPGRPPALTDAR